MSIIEQKEKNLNQLINKLNSITSTYSQPTYEVEKINSKEIIYRIVYNSSPDNFLNTLEAS